MSRGRVENRTRSITKRKNELENGEERAASREHEDKLFGGRRCRPLDDRNYRRSHSDSAHASWTSRQFLSVTLTPEILLACDNISLIILHFRNFIRDFLLRVKNIYFNH